MKVKLLKKLRDRFRIYKKGNVFYFFDRECLNSEYEIMKDYKHAKEKQRKEILFFIEQRKKYKRIL